MRKNLCKALSNEVRVNLLACLGKPKTVTDMQRECTLSQSALSQHLKVLKDANIVKIKKSGKYMFYEVSDKKVLKIAQLLVNYK